MSVYQRIVNIAILVSISATFVSSDNSPKEEDYFKIMRVSIPAGIVAEVGGLETLPDGRMAIATRRGDIYLVENPTSSTPYYRKFATGLHEPLGLTWYNGAIYTTQRSELTRIEDADKDGVADSYRTIFPIPVTDNYHEYSYGPVSRYDGKMFISTNLGFWPNIHRGESRVPWRGWVLRVDTAGRMTPWATGMRSPAGMGIIDSNLFYTDNQGDWVPSGGLWHIRQGDFTGNPAGLVWSHLPESPVRTTYDSFASKIDTREIRDGKGGFVRPENIVDEDYLTHYKAKELIPELRLPAVWLPHGILGTSSSEPIKIPDGYFGPFEGQVLVGDQGMSMISRVFLEKVEGEYQGAAIAFRKGFSAGVVRLAWGADSSLFVGETNRGWHASGTASEGLERLLWTGKIPFEMKAVRAMTDGFEIEFTQPVELASATNPNSYSISSFIYKYHPVYGSPQVGLQSHPVRVVEVSENNLKVRIAVDSIRRYYIHTINAEGVRSQGEGYPLLHSAAYYTLNNIPNGSKIVVPTTLAQKQKQKPQTSPSNSSQMVDFSNVLKLLERNTCTSCHSPNKRLVGPSYREIAQRNYSNEKIMELIYNPQPENWPEFPTAMPPMTHIPKDEVLRIAEYINSFR